MGSFDETVAQKISDARQLVLNCVSSFGMGVYASEDDRYMWQLWTRDPVLAGFAALALIGRTDVIRAHLAQLITRQAPNGKIPILFLDNPRAFEAAKVARSRETGRTSFMLQAFRSLGGVEDLTPWTKDSELLFIVAALTYADLLDGLPYVEAVDRAWGYLSKHHIGPKGTMQGFDWRDTRTDLGEAVALSNNSLLYQALTLMGRTKEATALKVEINETFWQNGHYVDYLGTEDVDTLGQALGVLHDVIPSERYSSVVASFTSLATSWGYMTGNCKPNPVTDEERALVERMPQSLVIWPFIHDYAGLALLRMNEPALARNAFIQSTKREGFCEWYARETGAGHGAKRQMWTAANYLRLAAAHGYDVRA